MTLENAEETLVNFVSRDKGRPLNKSVVSGKFAYSTDGRIGLRIAIGEDVQDSIPEGYPIESLRNIIESAVNCGRWFSMNDDEFMSIAEEFKKVLDREISSDDRQYKDRYKELVCPSCGDTIYLDTWSEELVEDREERMPVEGRDISYSVNMKFGDDSGVFGMGYLYMIRRFIGKDVLFAIENGTDKDVRKLMFKTIDGSTEGVLMPMRSYDECSAKATLKMVAEAR